VLRKRRLQNQLLRKWQREKKLPAKEHHIKEEQEKLQKNKCVLQLKPKKGS